jgi:hypothetical protein
MAQTNPKLAVISFDVLGVKLDKTQLTELLRLEISKHEKYEMIDHYELAEMLQTAKVDNTSYFSKMCLKKAGKTLNADYMISGSADVQGDALFIRLRMIDQAGNTMKKEVVREFLNISEKANSMISICVNELLDQPNDEFIVISLSNREIAPRVLAAEYSLKSGKLNIPINKFAIPSKENLRYGFSFGFNVRKQ